MKQNKIKWVITAILCLLHLIWWVMPSNVAYLIAQDRDILLGRYSLDRFTVMIFGLLLTWPVLYLLWADTRNRRERIFRTTAVFIGIIFGVMMLDFGLRATRKTARYVSTENIYHRPPNTRTTGIFQDLPDSLHMLIEKPPGHPDVPFTLTVDNLGFRNKSVPDSSEVVALGDSFTEGSGVSDDQAWPVLYAAKSGHTLYNLGMSGGSPSNYVEICRKWGVEKHPRIVVCMFYEGNDFRGSGELVDRAYKYSSFRYRFKTYVKTSPVVIAVKLFFMQKFTIGKGHIGSQFVKAAADLHTADQQEHTKAPAKFIQQQFHSWLPVAVPPDRDTYYHFNVKRLLCHYTDMDNLAASGGWKTIRKAIDALNQMCKEHGIRLVILYAPDKPHVIMPLLKERLTDDEIYKFISLKKNTSLSAAQVRQKLYANLDNCENLVASYCSKKGIEFLSTTATLREALDQGVQVYYTYDQHWTSEGHSLVADLLWHYLDTPRTQVQ
ncbi:MAG: hypothetical protein KKC46_00980 [Proteobacteria bacterium]|nr:hypothetical protein [Pseudomonadota bacterium]